MIRINNIKLRGKLIIKKNREEWMNLESIGKGKEKYWERLDWKEWLVKEIVKIIKAQFTKKVRVQTSKYILSMKMAA